MDPFWIPGPQDYRSIWILPSPRVLLRGMAELQQRSLGLVGTISTPAGMTSLYQMGKMLWVNIYKHSIFSY